MAGALVASSSCNIVLIEGPIEGSGFRTWSLGSSVGGAYHCFVRGRDRISVGHARAYIGTAWGHADSKAFREGDHIGFSQRS